MQPGRLDRGEMSQDSSHDRVSSLHPSVVTPGTHSRRIDPASRRAARAYAGLSSSTVGLELGLSVVIGIVGGMLLDRWLGTTPWLMLVGLVYGLAAGFRSVMRAVRRAEREGAIQDGLDGPGMPGAGSAAEWQGGVVDRG